jgi:hypothetical protein
MFSATLSKEIRPVCKKFMQDVMSLMASTTWIRSLFFILLKFPETFLVVSNAVVSSIFTSDRVSVYALLFICPIFTKQPAGEVECGWHWIGVEDVGGFLVMLLTVGFRLFKITAEPNCTETNQTYIKIYEPNLYFTYSLLTRIELQITDR